MIASAQQTKVQSYIDGVLSGDIVVGNLVRAAVERHVADLERAENDDSFPFHFDYNAAECACEYFPTCLRHSIGMYAQMPFELEPWQAFGIWVLLGWKRDADGTRRFRKAYWSTGRKNGKSTFGGGLAMLLASCDINPTLGVPEPVADVILCATKREQVEKIMFAEMKRMRMQSPEILAASELKNNILKFHENEGTVRCIGSDRPYSGLNPSVVVKDELHEFREFHRDLLNTMDTGGGSRCQPLDIVTTTAGDTESYIWREVYDYFRSVVLGQVQDESVFMWCFEVDAQDDPLDEANWPKANPNLGVSVRIEFLRDEVAKARSSAVALNTFTRYYANRAVSSTEQAFDMDLWDKCEGELSDWKTADVVTVGADLGGRDDLAGRGSVARFIDGTDEETGLPLYRYEIRSQGYIAEDGQRDLTQQPFAGWCYENKLIKSKYPISDLRDDLIAECRAEYVEQVAFDPSGAQQFAEELEAEGLKPIAVAQSTAMFNEPIGEFLQAIRDGRLRHNGDPVLRWCANNSVIIRDRQDRWMFDKRASAEKIDLIVAVVMAFRLASLAPQRITGSLYL